MHKRLSTPRNLKTLTLTILAVCIWFISTSVLADDSTLGDPPSILKDITTSSKVEFGTQNDYPATTNYYIYLPLIQRDRGGLSVNIQNRQDSLNFFLEQYLTSEGAAINWTGNHSSCDPGTTDQNFRLAALRRINYFRAMAGVPADITFSDESNRKAQAAALMMSVNSQLSHTPPTSWICYSTDGANGAGQSDLYLGVYSWNAITGYMKDSGAGNYPVGHRRWILYPQTQVMGTGDIPRTQAYSASNALLVFDSHMWEQRPQTHEKFVSWPPPGYVPYQVVFPRWSFSLANADFSGASVTMESDGSNLSVNQADGVNGFGENSLVWIPMGLKERDNWPLPEEDTIYTVTIHNVVDNNQSSDFIYNVIVFNPVP